MEKVSCIYQILNNVNGKMYIGSAVDYRKRINVHTSDLKRNDHHSSYLQHSWNKYGEDNFSFNIIEVIEKEEELLEREQFWMDHYKSYDNKNGYNVLRNAGSRLGFRATEETKVRQSESQKGRTFTKKELEKRTGERHSNSKIKEEEAIAIKRLIMESDMTFKEISEMFNVNQSIVNGIARRNTWKNAGGFVVSSRNNRKGKKTGKFSSEYKGVSFSKRWKCYSVFIRHNGESLYLGKYDDEIVAANVYNHKSKELCGESAYINDVPHVIDKEECEKMRKNAKGVK